jgi:hypothetical protein
MYDDDFLDRLLDSSGDDLDRLIQYDRERKRHRRPHDDIPVDMSDVERILNGSLDPPDGAPSESTVVSLPERSDGGFGLVYERLADEAPPPMGLRVGRVLLSVLKALAVAFGVGVGLCGAVRFSQLLLSLFPTHTG